MQFAAVLSASAFFWNSAFAAQDLYFNTADSPDFNRYLNDSSNWFTDEGRTQRFEGTLGSEYNGIVTGMTDSSVAGGSALNLNSLTIVRENISAGDNFMLAAGGAITLAENLVFNINLTGGTWGIRQDITLYSNIDVGGNMVVNYSRESGVNSYCILGIVSGTGNRLHVGGDFSVNLGANTTALRFYTKANITVDGIMRMENFLWQNGTNSQQYHTLGGMSGNGMIVNYDASYTSINLTNSTVQESSLTFGATTEDSKLDISMKGSESGRQIIRFNVGTWEGTDANINDVIVDSGRLDIGMRTGMTGNRLSLVGTQAVFSATSRNSGDIGTVIFNEGEWYAGKIAVDIEGELAYDKIVFNGRFDKTGSDRDMGFEFSFDEYAMRDFISAGDGEFILEDVITYETGSTMADTVFDGNTRGIQWEAVFGDTSLSVTFTVPEPATAAAVIGAIALALAAYRRKK